MTRKKFKNICLKTFTGFMFVLFWVSLCAIDSQSYIPMVTFGISWAWLMYFAWANGWFSEDFTGEDEDDADIQNG